MKPGWLLDRITIDVDERDEHYVFYCNRWLGSSDTAVEFIPGNCDGCVAHACLLLENITWQRQLRAVCKETEGTDCTLFYRGKERSSFSLLNTTGELEELSL